MQTFKFTTSDEKFIALAKAYWQKDSSGKWLYKMIELETQYDIRKGKVHATVSGVCKMSDSELACPTCSNLFEFSTHTGYESSLELKKKYIRLGREIESCHECQMRAAVLQRAEEEAQNRRRDEIIKNWLLEPTQAEPLTDYTQIALKHAFLLDGLLRYAGDDWREDKLDAWVTNKPKLCDSEEDIRTAYFELHLAGLIAPSANSPLDAFIVYGDDVIGFDELRVNWTIASDTGGAPYSELLRLTDTVLRSATAKEMRPIWEWVSL